MNKVLNTLNICLLSAAFTTAYAADTWKGSVDNDWLNAANWNYGAGSNHILEGDGGDSITYLDGTYTQTPAGVQLRGGHTVIFSNSAVLNVSGNINMGADGTATVIQSGGAVDFGASVNMTGGDTSSWTISGGTLTANGMNIGSLTNSTLAIVGDSASVEAAGPLTAGAFSTFSFELGATGIDSIDQITTMTISSNSAALTIDGAAYTGGAGTISLFSYGSIADATEFTETISGFIDLDVSVVYSGTSIDLVLSPTGGGNVPPTADAQSITMFPGTSTNLTLTGNDYEGSSLTYDVEQPSHGTLVGAANVWTYTPTSGYQGEDSFTFTVNDGTDDSSPATVTITVTNEVPVANGQSLEASPNVPLGIMLSGTDADNGPSDLIYIVSSTITADGGILSGATNSWDYSPPSPVYQGVDSFTFAVSDGVATSEWATVLITVTNYPPVADAQSVGMLPGTNLVITLTGSDVDGPGSLTYEVVDSPTNGTLNTASLPEVTYTPNAGFEGSDSFTFKVNDGLAESAPVAVSILVKTPNTIAGYDFSGVHSGTSDVTVVSANVIASGFSGGPGIGFNDNTGVIETIGDNTGQDALGLPFGTTSQLGCFRENQSTAGSVGSYANAVAGDRYLTFKVTPDGGYALNLESLTFKAGLANAARSPEFFALNTSVDGFATSNVVEQGTVSTVITTGEYESFSISLADTQFQNIAEETEFRLYIWGATAQSSTSATSYDKVLLNGTVNSLVPTINASISGGSLVMTWDIETTYDVLTNANLALPNWGVAESDASSPVTNAIGSESQLFYKLSK